MADARHSTNPSAPERRAIPPGARLNWNDPAAVLAWLAGLRVAWDDADSVLQDMLRRKRKRDLGPAEHRRLYRDAAAKIETALAFAEPGEPEPDATT